MSMRRLGSIGRRTATAQGRDETMKKNVLASSIAFLIIASASAQATEYVCELGLMPSVVDPTRGSYGYVSLYTSQQPNCGGATAVYSICSKGSTSHACGVTAQYSEASLIAIYEALRSSEASQHLVVPFWSACNGVGGSCAGGVLLYPDF
jgi:hypothetical protein